MIRDKSSWMHDPENICMCGDYVKDHNIGHGHTPVSMADYYNELYGPPKLKPEGRKAAIEHTKRKKALAGTRFRQMWARAQRFWAEHGPWRDSPGG